MSCYECCGRMVPSSDGHRQEGAEWVCPECQRLWVWVEDEAEGGFFTLITVQP